MVRHSAYSTGRFKSTPRSDVSEFSARLSQISDRRRRRCLSDRNILRVQLYRIVVKFSSNFRLKRPVECPQCFSKLVRDTGIVSFFSLLERIRIHIVKFVDLALKKYFVYFKKKTLSLVFEEKFCKIINVLQNCVLLLCCIEILNSFFKKNR